MGLGDEESPRPISIPKEILIEWQSYHTPWITYCEQYFGILEPVLDLCDSIWDHDMVGMLEFHVEDQLEEEEGLWN